MNLREVFSVPHAALFIVGASLRCVVSGDYAAVPVLWRGFGRLMRAAFASDQQRAARAVLEVQQRFEREGW